jgi:asparagine synthase (glutamine-hydrolysing)
MCGIAGFISRADRRPFLASMSACLRHRGPEAEGFWEARAQEWRLGFVHRRLRILDVSERSDQPMTRGVDTIVFNGEIYNFRELRRDLEKAGHAFLTGGDTEVILAAYAQWGAACLQRLEGMFAFAIWDGNRRELLLARDRVGKKPLFLHQAGSLFAFGSEIKAVLPALDRTPDIDAHALDHYLTYLYVPYPQTLFQGIRQLDPATCMRVRLEGEAFRISSERYWNPIAASASMNCKREPENQLAVGSLLSKAVSERMVSDAPLGVLLSGGLDSSSITSAMARVSNARVRSFSIGFRGDERYDETAFSRMVAERFGCEHQVLEADPCGVASLARVVWHFDQPFGNPTALLAYQLSALTKRYVTVALCGDGGDELFAGYPRYLGAYTSNFLRCLPSFVRKQLPRLGERMADDTGGLHQFRRLREFLESAGQSPVEMYLDWIGYFSTREKLSLYSAEFAQQTEGHHSGEFLRGLYRESEGLEPLNRFAYVDIRSFLPCNVLEYADRMSMAHALELRAPFCDRRLIEFSLRVPFDQKFRYGQSKRLLRRAMQSSLPEAVLQRRKLGFNPPMGRWLRGELKNVADELVGSRGLAARGLFRPIELSRLLRQQRSGVRDVSLKIWALMVLEVWLRLYRDAASVNTVEEQLERACSERSAPVGLCA